MLQWEYLYIVADRDEVFKINSELIERTDLPNYMRHLGQEGWELVGITAEGAATGYWRLVFKRPQNPPEKTETYLAQIVHRIGQVVRQQTQIIYALRQLAHGGKRRSP
jgi:hypothetical protein